MYKQTSDFWQGYQEYTMGKGMFLQQIVLRVLGIHIKKERKKERKEGRKEERKK